MKTLNYILFALVLFSLSACKSSSATTNKMTAKNGWITLFDGTDLSQWHAYNGGEPTQWSVVDGEMIFKPAENRRRNENLVTNEVFDSFILNIDWKISEGGNSGIMWAVQEKEAFREPYVTGPEIQILDDEKHPDSRAGVTHRSGALYDMIGAPAGVVKPVGEWNNYLITINHEANEGIVVMNGVEVVKFPLKGAAWDEMVAKSKFSNWSDFRKVLEGKIALQDHGHEVAFRNIKIKKL